MTHRDNAFNVPIRISYRPPLSLLYFMAFTHLGAIVSLALVSVPIVIFWLLLALILGNGFFHYRNFKSQSAATPGLELCLGKANEWTLLGLEDDVMTLRLLPGAVVHQLLLILRFVDENGRSHCFILNKDNVAVDIRRRLRVRLIHGASI